jgi:hypothetical protein
MSPKRMITIESPQWNTLMIQVEADVVDKFVKVATGKKRLFRGRNETFQHAIESAVTVAFTNFTDK